MKSKNIHEIIELLKSDDITLFVKDNQLGIKSKKTTQLPEALLAMIKANKEELITFLNSQKNTPVSKVRTVSDYGLPTTITNKRLKEFLELPVHESKVSNIYPLTPLQKGFLFHNLYDDNKSDYICQFHCDLKGAISKASFDKTWTYLIQQHTILRTAVFGQDLDIPVQCVYDEVQLPVREIDYSTLSNADFESAFDTFLTEDKEAGFNFEKAPLFRMTLINRGAESTRFVFTHHHIILDGWSVQNIMKNFHAAYLQLETTGTLPEVAVDDFGSHLRHISGLNEAKGMSYWKNYLAALSLPGYIPFVKDISLRNKLFGNKKIEFTINGAIKEFTKKHRITENTLLQGAWAYLLSKYTGNETVAFGATILGRDSKEENIETKIGLYINTIPVCSTVKNDTKIADWLQELQKEHTIGREEYGHLALNDIESQSNLRGSLFDTLISFQNYPEAASPAETDAKLSVENIEGIESTNYTISLIVYSSLDKLNITLKYNNEFISDEMVLKIKGHLEIVIQSLLSDVGYIKGLHYLTKQEEHQLLTEFNNTKREYNKNQSIIDIFSQKAALYPERTALVFGSEEISYQELDMRSNQVAHYLVSEGVIPGTIVGLLFDRSWEMIVGILGVLKTGSGYLPLDPNLPEKRIEYMLDQSRATFLLSQQHYLEEYAAYLPVQAMDSHKISSQKTSNIAVKTLATDLAYCIFTSGSTGKPKGVMMNHGSVINLVNGLNELVYHPYEDKVLRVALLASYVFDASVQQIFGSLLQGHSLYILDDESRKDGVKLLSFYNENSIDLSDGTPTHLRLLVNSLEEKSTLTSLSSWILAGEVLAKDLVNMFHQKLGLQTQLYNFYGPTETCVDSTSFKVDPKKLDYYTTIPIGKPMPNERVYVTDNYGSLVPAGIVGELCIAGDGLAQRYIGDQSLTSEKFDSDWVTWEDRVYRTGDMVKWLPDGNLEYHGRKDDQLKIRGYRIEPTEIEQYLTAHPKIENSIIVVQEFENEKVLIAYYQAKAKINTADLRGYLAAYLPDYMIPSFYMHIENFLFTSNGKIDRKTLPAYEISPEKGIIPPSNDVEEKLIAIYSEVLKVDSSIIGVNSNFFDLGGHSLTMMFLNNKIEKVFKVKIPLKEMMRYATISDLSQLMSRSLATENGDIQPAEKRAYYPLSSSQKRMYFLHEYNKDSLAYNLPAVITLNGALDKEKLQLAYQKLIKRHNNLRTSFEFAEGNPVQRILPDVDFSIADLAKEEDVNKTIKNFIRPFDLHQAPLVRVGIISASADEHIMIIDTHHIISDEVTNGLLLRDLTALYKGETLSDLAVQYQDYVMWRLEEKQQKEILKQKEYWLGKFSDEVPALQLPYDHARTKEQSEFGDKYAINLTTNQIDQLKKMARAEGVTMYSLILAMYNVLLSKLSNQYDIVVGTPVAGRSHADLEKIAGVFINTLAIRNQLDGEQDFTSFLHQVQEGATLAFENQLYPYDELIDSLDLERNGNRSPLFDVFLNYEFESEKLDLKDSDLKISNIDIPYPIAKFDLHLSVLETEENLELSLAYSKDLFEVKSAESFSFYFIRIVNAVLNNRNELLKNIAVLSEEEQNQVLVEFNDTAKEYNTEKTVLDLFAEQVTLHPDNKALLFEEESVTYKELDVNATNWALYLIEAGIKPGDVVALRMTRSIEMITAILAIIKSGAAYLIIDANLPDSRAAHMMEETASLYIITNTEERTEGLESYFWIPVAQLAKNTTANETTKLPEINSDSLAYILYTSGSTGKPKGCMISHANLFNYIFWSNSFYFNNSEEGNWGIMSSMSFDLSVTAIFTSLTRGKKLFIGNEKESLDKLLQESFNNPKIDTLKLTPTHITLLKDLDIQSTNVSTIICGGEQLKKSHIQILKDLNQNMRIYNEYGPTETTVGCSSIEVSINDTPITVGCPAANTKMYILDTHLKVVPVGVTGELYIGGAGVSRGYINNPVLTAERFVPIEGATCYKTGDLARWDSDGRIEYLGRIDDQIKIRGYRIEPGEIELVLESLPLLEQAFVTVKGADENKQLYAYLKGIKEIPTAELKEILADVLPNYMIPSHFIWLDAFPYTTNGKIDQKALFANETQITVSYVAPSNYIEEKLVTIWSEILDLERDEISVESNFINLGGHSLNVIQMANTINKEFGVQIKLDDIFNGKTIRQLSESIEMKTWLETENDQKSTRKEIVL
ncbi:amino acid adenylation domain-containing protein [Flavobacterium cupreum]|uniref:Amino acid adenylation domain-containing protein n=1 Tax=Flavobacterium cupreum TaxID=2133766 RepID=A0A434A2J9_9FLAO|nr:non-ribosomal peptide synthetase [Flavobacterium cupreum]RUT68623.1 amino acid adenylation domain-containing protein [Flavobacterium cupreum]